MNKKVILVWSIFILLFGAIGVYGMMNKDIVEKDKTTTQKVTQDNPVSEYNNHICSSYEPFNISYSIREKDDKIDSVRITVRVTNQTMDYTNVTSVIENTFPAGINYKTVDKFEESNELLLSIEPDIYLYEGDAEFDAALAEFGVKIYTTQSYEEYGASLGSSFICE